MTPDEYLTLCPERPVAGGRMLARHEGMVVLVAGAIPGERVRVRIERAERSLAFASVSEVLDAHPARREPGYDPRCGGAAYAHIAYPHQLLLKGQVVEDALSRMAHVAPPQDVAVAGSPERGYRMRARLHVRHGCAGFFLEGTHRLCDAMGTGQLIDSAGPALRGVVDELRRAGLRGDADIELSENIPGDQRALHVELERGTAREGEADWSVIPGLTGLSWSERGSPRSRILCGEATVVDWVDDGGALDGRGLVRLQRHARAFFQANRFLLPDLVRRVGACCLDGPVLDLYAGVGLFGVTLAASGRRVTAVEGHRASAADLRANAVPYGDAIEIHEAPVEAFLGGGTAGRPRTVIVDPPRTGMTRDAVSGVIGLQAERLVFVSCDVATFGRDVRRFMDAGYTLEHVEGFDLFPNTAHVEVLGVLGSGPKRSISGAGGNAAL